MSSTKPTKTDSHISNSKGPLIESIMTEELVKCLRLRQREDGFLRRINPPIFNEVRVPPPIAYIPVEE